MPLETNWRETGDYYVCGRSGSDSNPGTEALPFRTIGKALSLPLGRIIIRSGYYNEGDLLVPQATKTIYLIGDGLVIFDLSSYSSLFSQNLFNKLFTTNIKFINGVINTNPTVNNNQAEFSDSDTFNCTIKKIGGSSVVDSVTEKIVFDSSIIELLAENLMFRVSFISTTILDSRNVVYQNSVFCADSELFTSGNQSNRFTSCCFESVTGSVSQFKINGAYIGTIVLDDGRLISEIGYGNKFTGTFTIIGTGNVFNFIECFISNDLGFNNVVANDYTLSVSPQSILFNSNNIIGCHGLYQSFRPSNECFNPSRAGVSYTDLLRNLVDDRFELELPAEEGVVTSSNDLAYAINLGEEITLNNAIRFFGSFNFFNGDWIDRQNFDLNLNLETRFTFRLQFYDSITSTWSGWIEQEVDVLPQIDSSGLGVGNVNVDFDSVASLKSKYFRVELTLRTNGV